MKKLKFGIIGCGGIANGKHMPAYKALGDEVELCAFCDIIEERAVKPMPTTQAARAKFSSITAIF